MGEHTPTPWRFDGDWYRLPTIYGADGKMIAYVEKDKREATPERAANAALIVKAVNNHEALVKALEEIDTLAVCTGVVDPKQHVNMLCNIARIAREALAKVSQP